MIQVRLGLPESILVSGEGSVIKRIRSPRSPNGDKPERPFTELKDAPW